MKQLQTLNISRFTPFLRSKPAGMMLLLLAAVTFSALAQQAVDDPLSDTAVDAVVEATATINATEVSTETAIDESAVSNALISELAASSDVVVIAKVLYTSYEYRRGFPIDGYADLSVLIPYKTETTLDRIRVRDSGFKSDACYFPATYPGQDGARFLLFLSRHPDGDFRGNPLTCKLSVVVTDNHRYALRYPFEGNVDLNEEQSAWVEQLNFNDPFAFAGEADLTIGRKQALAEQIDGIVDERGVKYTKGLLIRYFSQLIGEENLQKPSREGRY